MVFVDEPTIVISAFPCCILLARFNEYEARKLLLLLLLFADRKGEREVELDKDDNGCCCCWT